MLTVSLWLMVTSNFWSETFDLVVCFDYFDVCLHYQHYLSHIFERAQRCRLALLQLISSSSQKGSRIKFFAFSSIILTNPLMIGLIPMVLSVQDSPSDLERRGFVDPDWVTKITDDLINRRARAHIRRSQNTRFLH